MTRHVEPQTTDRQSEEEELRRPTDTTGENERVAMTDGAYLSEGRAFVPLRLGGTVRKKQRWRLPPKTVVRLKIECIVGMDSYPTSTFSHMLSIGY